LEILEFIGQGGMGMVFRHGNQAGSFCSFEVLPEAGRRPLTLGSGSIAKPACWHA
jgi:hypothetical protein